jgi:hypothetical protein
LDLNEVKLLRKEIHEIFRFENFLKPKIQRLDLEDLSMELPENIIL